MNIVIAPDSFKESMTAREAAKAIARGILAVWPQATCVSLPMADGGEGSAATLLAACGGEWREVRVHNPLMHKVTARYAVLNDGRAVIEMAEAAGLHLIQANERNPLVTSTFGVGELLLDALNQGARDIIMAIGGSATNDGGAGMLRALGYRLCDASGEILPEGGAALANLHHIDSSQVIECIQACQITVACDVNNPLCGANGASVVFAPQKGADVAMIRLLDDALCHFANITADFLQCDWRDVAGSGAAGGLGFALQAFLGAKMRAGVDLFAEAVGLEHALQHADLVITGEGKIDGQTVAGKVPYGVLQRAKDHGLPVIALVGCLGEDISKLNQSGFTAVLPIIPRYDNMQSLLDNGAYNLEYTARQVAALWQRTIPHS